MGVVCPFCGNGAVSVFPPSHSPLPDYSAVTKLKEVAIKGIADLADSSYFRIMNSYKEVMP